MRASTINSIFKNDLKRYWVVDLMYLILIFLNIPLNMLILLSKSTEKEELMFSLTQMFNYQSDYFIFGILILTILMCMLLIREVQGYRSNIHIFSLPFSKKNIFYK
jgi:ABC-type spermidine/putrescine transport system permease subunit II